MIRVINITTSYSNIKIDINVSLSPVPSLKININLLNTRLGFVSRLIVLPAFSAINTFFRRSNSHSSKLQGIERWLIALKPFFLFFVQSNQPETHFKLKTSHWPLSKLSLIPYDLFEALCTAQGRIWLIRTWMINRGANKEKTDPAMYDVQPKDDITSSRSPSRSNLCCIWMSFFPIVVIVI